MKQRFITLAASACAALLAALTMSSCKEDSIIKSSLTPAVDNIHTFGIGPDFNNGTDTVTMLTGTDFQDSVITSARGNGFPIFHALGYMTDPFAGKTAASIYAQFVPTATGVKLTGNLDELVLVLPYAGFTWGDTTVPSQHNVNVHAITEDFSKDSTYYNYSSKATSSTIIGSGVIITGPAGTAGRIQDSVTVRGKKTAPHLRISLSEAFKNEFSNALAYDTSYIAFTKQFKGLYLVVTDSAASSARSLPYFRLNGTAAVYGSAALLAYTGGKDSPVVQFPYLENYAAHFNRIRRNWVGYPITNLLDKSVTQSYLAMQNAPGAVIDLRLPFIHKLPKNVVINKAEITFTMVNYPGQSTMDDVRFFGPARLYPQGINTSGGQYTIADRYPVNDQQLEFMDGTPTTAVVGGQTLTTYKLNIPREVQQAIIANNQGLHLRIGGTVNFPAAYRLVVAGRGFADNAYRPKINIIYSKQ